MALKVGSLPTVEQLYQAKIGTELLGPTAKLVSSRDVAAQPGHFAFHEDAYDLDGDGTPDATLRDSFGDTGRLQKKEVTFTDEAGGRAYAQSLTPAIGWNTGVARYAESSDGHGTQRILSDKTNVTVRTPASGPVVLDWSTLQPK